MIIPLALSWLALTAPPVTQEAPPFPEGNAYVRSVLDAGPRSQDAAINDFVYDVAETKENLDKHGVATSRETLAYEVYFVDTRPVRRLVSRNGTPLKAREQAEVDKKAEALAQAIAEGRTVSERPGIRLSGLVDSFRFETVSRADREGRTVLIFDFAPKANPTPGVRLGGVTDKVARILGGRVQIDEGDRRVIRLDAWSLPGEKAGIRTGVKLNNFQLSMEYARVEEGVWLPRLVVRLVEGKAFFFKTFRVRHTTTYSNYRRFRVETEQTVR